MSKQLVTFEIKHDAALNHGSEPKDQSRKVTFVHRFDSTDIVKFLTEAGIYRAVEVPIQNFFRDFGLDRKTGEYDKREYNELMKWLDQFAVKEKMKDGDGAEFEAITGYVVNVDINTFMTGVSKLFERPKTLQDELADMIHMIQISKLPEAFKAKQIKDLQKQLDELNKESK